MFSKFYDEKIKNWTTDICHVLELIVAIFVLIGVVMALISTLSEPARVMMAMLSSMPGSVSIIIGVFFIKFLSFLFYITNIVTHGGTFVKDIIYIFPSLFYTILH